jgi:hypothetical protein
VTVGVTLTAGDSPVSIYSTGMIDTNDPVAAVYGPSAAYTIINAGTVYDSATNSVGIKLSRGGTIINTGSTAMIGAASVGVKVLNAAAYISNAGTIRGNQGVLLNAGGTITNNQGATIYGTSNGIQAGVVTITNLGTISSGPTITSTAIELEGNGLVSNASTGTIIGGAGIAAFGGDAGLLAGTAGNSTIFNSGLISGTQGSGINLTDSGLVSNAVHGTIDGADYGVSAISFAATVSNAGLIASETNSLFVGVTLNAGGVVSNASTGSIYGVAISGGAGTVYNAGYLGLSGRALKMAPGYANELEVAPGARFAQGVDGGNAVGGTATSTLVLLPGTASGTLTGLGDDITNFGGIVFSSGASWVVGGEIEALAEGQTISGFARGDTISLAGVFNESVTGFNNGTLSLGGPFALNIILPGSYSAADFVVRNDNQLFGTDISIACFAEGTRILTPDGEVAVERLKAGDLVLTFPDLTPSPIIWRGRRHVHPGRHASPDRLNPVRVRVGALGEGAPHRDLRLSPDHAVFHRGVLVPVRLLINGETILREAVSEITYFHLALPEHQIVIAEGLTCETYLDTGDRTTFENNDHSAAPRSDFVSALWEGASRAPLVLSGPLLAGVRADVIRHVPNQITLMS